MFSLPQFFIGDCLFRGSRAGDVAAARQDPIPERLPKVCARRGARAQEFEY